MSVFNSALFVINEVYADEYVKQHMTPLEVTKALAKEGLLMPDGMAYEYGDNGWDDETNSPMHYPVEPSCRDDDHYCPESAPPRYRRLVGPWEEA